MSWTAVVRTWRGGRAKIVQAKLKLVQLYERVYGIELDGPSLHDHLSRAKNSAAIQQLSRALSRQKMSGKAVAHATATLCIHRSICRASAEQLQSCRYCFCPWMKSAETECTGRVDQTCSP